MNPAVRESTSADVPEIRRFFADLPTEDRTFFYQDVDDPAVIDAWASDQRRIRRCAVDERGQIVALAALQAGLDWTSHVADLVLLVRPEARRQGLGRMMARRMLLEAVNHGFMKVSVLVAADDTRAIDMFEKLGFEGEALLRDQLCNPREGQLRDAVILSHMVDDPWSTMLTTGYEQAVS